MTFSASPWRCLGGRARVQRYGRYRPCSHRGHAWTVLSKPAPAEALGPNNSISPNAAGRPEWVGGTAGLNPTATVYAHFNGTKWATVQGATRLSGVFAAFVVTAHVPATNATWAVGGSAKDTAAGVSPDKVIIEFNPGVHGE
jgi:hypothetical protein